MKSLRIVRACVQRYVARSKKGSFSMKEPRTLLTVFVVTFGATILLAGVWVQSAASAGGGGGSKGPKGGKKVPHMLEFSGDIASVPISVKLNLDNPLNNVRLDDFVVDFNDFERGDPTCGCVEGESGCSDPFVDGWGGYADGLWTGPMIIRKRAGTWRVNFNEGTNALGHINLVVGGGALGVGTTEVVFDNERSGISAFSTPDGETIDSDNRCLSFTITATKIIP